MGEDRGSWFPQQHFDWQLQSPKLNSVSDPLELGQPNGISACMNSYANVVSTNGNSLVDAFSQLPHLRVGQANEPHGWFYCLPRFRQVFAPVPNPIIKEKLPVCPYECSREASAPNAGSKSAQKRFLVFDQSGDQATLVFSSVIGAAPFQPMTSWSPKPFAAYNLNGEDTVIKRDPINLSGPILTDELNENHGTDPETELHEDTEELDALLYSDDDSDDIEDDDEMSTGHSPSTMTDHDNQECFEDNQECFEGSAEEVASSDGLTKRRKLSGGGYDVPSLMDTASSMKPNRFFEYDNAESSCADGLNPGLEEMVSLSGNKRMRNEKIRETVSILQSIIPGGKGKDAIVVLDEAIRYLKSLKLKAKSLGLSTP